MGVITHDGYLSSYAICVQDLMDIWFQLFLEDLLFHPSKSHSKFNIFTLKSKLKEESSWLSKHRQDIHEKCKQIDSFPFLLQYQNHDVSFEDIMGFKISKHWDGTNYGCTFHQLFKGLSFI